MAKSDTNHDMSEQPKSSGAGHEGHSSDVRVSNNNMEDDHMPTIGTNIPDADTDASAELLDGKGEAASLAQLTTKIRDQDDMERKVGQEADEMLLKEEHERDEKRLERSHQQKERAMRELHTLKRKANHDMTMSAAMRVQTDIEVKEEELASLDRDIDQIKQRLESRHREAKAADAPETTDQAANHQRPSESKREFLIRTGKITPFSKVGHSLTREPSNLAEAIVDAEDSSEQDAELAMQNVSQSNTHEPLSHRNLLEPGFAEDVPSSIDSTPAPSTAPPSHKRRRLQRGTSSKQSDEQRPASSSTQSSNSAFVDEGSDAHVSDEESDVESDGPGFMGEMTDTQAARASKKRPNDKISRGGAPIHQEDLSGLDDGNERLYQKRLNGWATSRRAARDKAASKAGNVQTDASGEVNEWRQPHPTRADGEFENGFRVPGDIYPSLFDYQKTGVKWLWELHQQSVGGILADEMGLGKTIQIIAFLAGLHYTGRYRKPTIVVVPATLMKQWVNEFHRWWPAFRVTILHSSGSGMLNVRSEDKHEKRLDRDTGSRQPKASKAARNIVDRVVREGHVLITTYAGLQANAEILIPVKWGYAILDEGQKIRNPNASITIHCKELRTHNRVILSGTPMQNNLTELWSLVDFVFPMRLGTLMDFKEHFDAPIRQGGYANASNLAVETAHNCARALKDSISPYLMQRFKTDVATDLPIKSEQVLFCKLTRPQREAYEQFLNSKDTEAILDGKRQALFGIDMLRKICNHPDLTAHKVLSRKEGYGAGNKSGKMQVVKALLRLWKGEGHKTLLFAQHRIMLDILEKFIKRMDGVNYCRMDGSTDIKARQDLVTRFNKDANLDVFLLTTKVGGLGVNLTGADRVIIYDPDWNPSTDVQARERAWRLGQQREVVIYRLMCGGTIEEKIYHRQLFKQFLSNKILKDPKQRSTFHLKGLKDLFTLSNVNDGETETGAIFQGSETRIEAPKDDHHISDVYGISYQEAFKDKNEQSTSTSTRTGSPSAASNAGSTAPRLMEALLGKSGVHASLSHDVIVDGNYIELEPTFVTHEAKRVAAQHATLHERARAAAGDIAVGVPTWTGTVGIAGRPEPHRPRPVSRGGIRPGLGLSRGGRGGAVGPSSSAVLANLASRRDLTTGARGTNADDESKMDFFESIPNFFHAHGGRVYSRMLVDHFQRLCSTPEKRQEFRDKLRRVAVVDRSVGNNTGTSSCGGASVRESGRAVMRNGTMSLGSERASGADEGSGRTKWVLKREFGGVA